MPKRRMSPARLAALAKAREASARARRRAAAKANAAQSYSHPLNKQRAQRKAYYAGELGGYAPPGLGGRSHKQSTKAYKAKTASAVTIAPGVAALLAGKAKPQGGTTSERLVNIPSGFHPNTIRGDIVPDRHNPNDLYRKKRKRKAK